MSEAILAKAVRQAAQSLSIAIFCAAITASILTPVASVIVFRAAMKWQAESFAAQMEEQANRPRVSP